jgi:lipopolysaccharide export system permease protein
MNGLWLRQGDARQQSVIHALRVAQQGEHLEDVLVLLYGQNDRFAGRIDAKSAELKDQYWLINDAWVSDLRGVPVHHDTYKLATTLTPEQIVESSTAPDALSFWDLPGYIRAAQAAGFSAARYQLYLYTLYALPALFAAMVFMAASFSLRPGRDSGMTKIILFSAACGFGVFFFQDLTMVLGRSGAVPILLAATAPALASILIGMTLVLSQEDG